MQLSASSFLLLWLLNRWSVPGRNNSGLFHCLSLSERPVRLGVVMKPEPGVTELVLSSPGIMRWLAFIPQSHTVTAAMISLTHYTPPHTHFPNWPRAHLLSSSSHYLKVCILHSYKQYSYSIWIKYCLTLSALLLSASMRSFLSSSPSLWPSSCSPALLLNSSWCVGLPAAYVGKYSPPVLYLTPPPLFSYAHATSRLWM